jgi:dihydrofolate reductase
MGKVLWHITMSLDGFIAGPGDAMDWVFDYTGPSPTADELLPAIGALLIGHRTYHLASTEEGRPYGGRWTGPMVVRSTQPPATAAPGFTFVADLRRALAEAKAAAGDKYVVILGAATAKQCLAAGELDEIVVHLVPLLLGDGVRLFEHPGGRAVKLERIGLTDTPTTTNLWLRVVK